MTDKLLRHEKIQRVELMLESAEDGLTTGDICRALDCNPATAYRYIETIREERELIKVGRDRYRLDPLEGIRTVRLHPTEALTIYLALRRFIRQTSKAPDFMATALRKVIPALRRPDLVDRLLRATQQLENERRAEPHDTTIWRTVIDGWLRSQIIRIQYQGLRDDSPTEHLIEPYLFEPMPLGDGNYLIAWSRTRNALRTFKPDRILRATLTGETFAARELSIDKMLGSAWGIWYGDTLYTVELFFPARVARRVMESVFLPTEQKTALADGTVLWRAEVSGLMEILSWVRSWGPDVQVIGPPQLREQIISELRAMLVAYESE
jgi:predicted DNA-binding transcriptional regulator YafY